MILISLPYLFNLNADLDSLGRLPETEVVLNEVFLDLFRAEHAVRTLTESSVYARYLRSSSQLAKELVSLLEPQTQKTDADAKVSYYELWAIKNKYRDYRIALLSELGVMSSYFITQKAGYDTATLLHYGEAIFPAELGMKVPEAMFDAREAAKCLAYEVATSAGFHVFRMVESVLRKYYVHVTGGAAPPKVRNIGVYLEAMRQANKGNIKIRGALKQIADLHRNPLVHPEAVLTMDEALAAAGIARSVVTAMLSEMPIVLPTTSQPVTTA